MKKLKKTAILSLCLSPLLLLTACVPPPSFTITASSSDMQLGYVQGVDKDAMEEGSKVTLNAIATTSSPFVCWIKDDVSVVSQEAKLNLTYNEKNAGHYTAIFEENDYAKMLYATFTDVKFSPSGYTKIEYQINTALMTSGSNDYYEFIDGEYTVGDEHSIEPVSVMYFGGAGDDYVYLLKIDFKLYDSANAETTYQYQMQTKISKNSFDDNGEFTINEEITALNSNISLKLKKLNSSMFEKDEDSNDKNNNKGDDFSGSY